MDERERSPQTTYLAVLAAAVLCYMALGAVLSILPQYVPLRLGGDTTDAGLAVGAPALSALIGRPLGGRLGDRIGPLLPILVGAGLMAAGAVPACLSLSLAALLGSRLIVGFGEGLMMSATVLWLMRLAGPSRRGRALGHIGLANYGGLALGPLLAEALGGATAAATILKVAMVLPLCGAALAIAANALVFGPRGLNRGTRGPDSEQQPRLTTKTLLRLTAPAGVGLLLVNVGYVAVLSLGSDLSRSRGTGLAALIVPVFAIVIIITRTLGGGIPDRFGGRRTVITAASVEAIGLLAYAETGSAGLAVAALLVLAVGQSLAVPGLGLLAMNGVPPSSQGAAAGLFFAWFDAGVGLGGPLLGAIASATSVSGGLDAAALAVAGVVAIVAVITAKRPATRARQLLSRA